MELIILTICLLIVAFAIAYHFLHQHYIKLMRKEVKRAQKSEQLKYAFIDNVSHTLRAPLNAILGYSNMILEEKNENLQPAQVKEMASNISDNTKLLIDFVTKLLELSKFEGITPSFTFIDVNLTELMASYRREALTFTKPDVSVRVSTDLSPHCHAVLDTNFMHQLMMHLLTNAANHITQGDIIIKYGKERKGLKVSITYSGIGQAAIIGADIYSLLQREDALTNINDTSALGLSICKAIIDVLDGEFYIDTEYDKKTVASFWFPCKISGAYKGI
jgi:K+-sensing histidine kinase KdpD